MNYIFNFNSQSSVCRARRPRRAVRFCSVFLGKRRAESSRPTHFFSLCELKIFKSTTTMKEYNAKRWWIDGNIIPEIRISADSVNDALSKYAEQVEEKHYISISRNALKNKRPMYVDTVSGESKQIGYVITGKADFQADNYKWVSQYVDIWAEIISTHETEF